MKRVYSKKQNKKILHKPKQNVSYVSLKISAVFFVAIFAKKTVIYFGFLAFLGLLTTRDLSSYPFLVPCRVVTSLCQENPICLQDLSARFDTRCALRKLETKTWALSQTAPTTRPLARSVSGRVARQQCSTTKILFIQEEKNERYRA